MTTLTWDVRLKTRFLPGHGFAGFEKKIAMSIDMT